MLFLFGLNPMNAQFQLKRSAPFGKNSGSFLASEKWRPMFSIYGDTTTSEEMSKMEKFQENLDWYMKYFPIPFASYGSETSWLFGVSKYNAFTLTKGDTSDHSTLASSVTAFAYLTLNNQYKVAIESNLMLNKNKAIWRTNLFYTDYPIEYFGVGNETKLENQRTLITSDWQFHTYYLFNVLSDWYVGPNFDLMNYYDVELAEGTDPLPSDSTNLVHNIGRQSGLGIRIQKEGRDNRFNAKKGWYVDASYQIYRTAFGSEYNYDFFQTDVRYYKTTKNKLTFAFQARTEAKTGDVPVQSLSELGGDFFMRGTYRGRYRDNILLDSQLELRFPIYWIFGGVIFNSVGQVAHNYGDFTFKGIHYNYGLGLRVQVDSKNNVNLRFDYALSSDQHYFLINFAEAF